MHNLVKVRKEVSSLNGCINVPDECQDAVFTTTFGKECKHYYYLTDLKNKRIISWIVDMTEVIAFFTGKIDNPERTMIPRNLSSLEQYIETLFVPHSAEYWNGSVYVSLTNGSFILVLSIDSDDYDVIYQEDDSIKKIYASTNIIHKDCIYFCRYDVEETFKRYEDYDYPVTWDVGRYCLKMQKFETFGTVKGSSDVHTATISPDGENMLFMEMCKDPVIRYPKDYLNSADSEKKREILKGGLIKSHLVRYNIREREAETIIIPDCPAHIEFDKFNPNIFYIVRHNNSTVEERVLCFGNGYLDKFEITSEGCRLIGTCTDEKFYRSPSHELTKYKDRQYVLCPSYPDHVFMFNPGDMTVFKKIKVRDSGYQIDNSNGAFVYPPGVNDLTPYTVHGVDDTPYIYITNIHYFIIYNYHEDKEICEIKYNFNNTPIRATGHSKRFKLEGGS